MNFEAGTSKTPQVLVHPPTIPIASSHLQQPSHRNTTADSSSPIRDALPVYKKGLDLEKQLRNCAVKHAIPGTKPFWPPSFWKALVTNDAIANELRKHSRLGIVTRTSTINKRARQIQGERSQRYVLIFTILVLVDKVNRLDHIMNCNNGISDHDLPLHSDNTGYVGPVFYRQDRKGRKSPLRCCFSNLKPVELEAFHEFQRRLTVPEFGFRHDNTLDHQDFHEEVILPWCEEVDVPPVAALSGGFGSVRRVKIHPLCHNFHEVLRDVRLG